jgi:uncharacterized protein
MKVAIIGATGFLGTSLVKEFAGRGHQVTAISRKADGEAAENVTYAKADVLDAEGLAAVLKGHDAVVSAYNSGWTNPNIYEDFIAGSVAIVDAVKKAGINRYITIGGAGSLYVAPGLQLIDTPEFPEEYKPGAGAAREFLEIIKNEKDIDWVFFSPAIEMHQGIDTGRTGNYRLGLDNPVFDENNRSYMSGEDVAVVLADEVENPKHHQQRFTAAY